MKYLFSFVVVLFIAFQAAAQNYWVSQVVAINGQMLKKVNVEVGSDGKYKLVGESKPSPDVTRSIYIDDNGGIRKFICHFNRKDGEYCIVAYYNRWGSLSSLIFRSWTVGGYLVEGNAQTLYFDGRKNVADTIAYTYKLKYDDGKHWTETEETGRSYIYPEQFGDLELAGFSSVPKLVEQYSIDWRNLIPSNSKSVRFDNPTAGDVTFITQNDTYVRRAPTINSTKVTTLNAGQRVWILGIARSETIGRLGTHNWYKVSLAEGDRGYKEMYVFGAFLEPVEQRTIIR